MLPMWRVETEYYRTDAMVQTDRTRRKESSPMTRLAFSFLWGFVIGVIVMVTAYDRQEEQKQKETAQKVKSCVGYLVVTLDGRTTECRLLMPRLDVTWPLPGDPVKLRKKDIRRAIGG